ncbi:ribosome-inactivating family protein [Microbulbifer sp. ANSA005]|uniref:ribosome-inactivating family protein n=1 Tax=Microbulbifer sp. ANSA005 TaxID=3243362 RepID=UPI0040431CA9
MAVFLFDLSSINNGNFTYSSGPQIYANGIKRLKKHFSLNRDSKFPTRVFIPIERRYNLGVIFYIRNSDLWLTGYSTGGVTGQPKNLFTLPDIKGNIVSKNTKILPFDGSYPSMGFTSSSTKKISIYDAYESSKHLYYNSDSTKERLLHKDYAEPFGNMAIFLSEAIRFNTISTSIKDGAVPINTLLKDAKNWKNYSKPDSDFNEKVDIKHLNYI